VFFKHFFSKVYSLCLSPLQPYAGMKNSQVLLHVEEGGTIKCPEGCPAEIFAELILPCFAWNPKDRPTFAKLAAKFQGLKFITSADREAINVSAYSKPADVSASNERVLRRVQGDSGSANSRSDQTKQTDSRTLQSSSSVTNTLEAQPELSTNDQPTLGNDTVLPPLQKSKSLVTAKKKPKPLFSSSTLGSSQSSTYLSPPDEFHHSPKFSKQKATGSPIAESTDQRLSRLSLFMHVSDSQLCMNAFSSSGSVSRQSSPSPPGQPISDVSSSPVRSLRKATQQRESALSPLVGSPAGSADITYLRPDDSPRVSATENMLESLVLLGPTLSATARLARNSPEHTRRISAEKVPPALALSTSRLSPGITEV
jgi:hypothetical protein